MDDKIFDQIQQVDLKKTMETSYIDYAMSVIASRALPDVRDGLKPVQRRVLYSMIELSNTPDKPHRKCARIVGDTMGKYHRTGIAPFTGHLSTWHSRGRPDIHLSTDMVTLVLWMETVLPPCDTQRQGFQKFPCR